MILGTRSTPRALNSMLRALTEVRVTQKGRKGPIRKCEFATWAGKQCQQYYCLLISYPILHPCFKTIYILWRVWKPSPAMQRAVQRRVGMIDATKYQSWFTFMLQSIIWCSFVFFLLLNHLDYDSPLCTRLFFPAPSSPASGINRMMSGQSLIWRRRIRTLHTSCQNKTHNTRSWCIASSRIWGVPVSQLEL